MKISLEEYRNSYQPSTVFDNADFLALNAYKVSEISVLADCGLALAFGLDAASGEWRAPFSAPFAMPAGEGDFNAFAKTLVVNCSNKFVLTPPPIFHSNAQEWDNALYNMGLRVCNDYNYHYPLERFESCKDFMAKHIKRDYNRALRQGFNLLKTTDLSTVYNFIANHHRLLGYRMSMSYEQIVKTSAVIDADFFVCMLGDTVVGAAIFYHVAPGIVQLINWGDDINIRSKCTANFIIFKAFEFYRNQGLDIVDLGPASSYGIKNEGLVRFKLAIGCVETLKPTFYSWNS